MNTICFTFLGLLAALGTLQPFWLYAGLFAGLVTDLVPARRGDET